ncbi:MAG: metallophosphoesterase [Armatimonadota bacterium]
MASGPLTIIHTADFHDRLTEAKAERLRELKAQHENCLLLDSGDALAAGNVTFRLRPERSLELMNRAGYDAMAIGNREYYFRKSILMRKTRPAQFSVLSSNLAPKTGDLGHVAQRRLLRMGDGLRVAIFALSREMIAPDGYWQRFSDCVFLDALEVARLTVGDLRETMDVLIALSHLGREGDEELLGLGLPIDFILGAHEHVEAAFDAEQDQGPPYVSYPGAFAQTAAIITARVENGRVAGAYSELIEL